jgi:hypothetical protein
MALAKLKAALRKAAARSLEALIDANRRRPGCLHSTRVSNFFAAAGYDRV